MQLRVQGGSSAVPFKNGRVGPSGARGIAQVAANLVREAPYAQPPLLREVRAHPYGGGPYGASAEGRMLKAAIAGAEGPIEGPTAGNSALRAGLPCGRRGRVEVSALAVPPRYGGRGHAPYSAALGRLR